MEQCFTLHGIIDELTKIHYNILFLDPKRWKWWQWCRNACQGYVAWKFFIVDLYECFDIDPHHLGHLTKLKQSITMEDFITAFEHLDLSNGG